MNALRITIAAMLLHAPVLALADGNKLLAACAEAERYLEIKSGEPLQMGYCLGMVQGVGSTLNMLTLALEPAYRVCLPSTPISNQQTVRIVNQYLRNNPAELHNDETLLIMLALKRAFPCK